MRVRLLEELKAVPILVDGLGLLVRGRAYPERWTSAATPGPAPQGAGSRGGRVANQARRAARARAVNGVTGWKPRMFPPEVM